LKFQEGIFFFFRLLCKTNLLSNGLITSLPKYQGQGFADFSSIFHIPIRWETATLRYGNVLVFPNRFRTSFPLFHFVAFLSKTLPEVEPILS